MDFIDQVREIAGRIAQRVDHVQTEEATKTGMVMPFINHVLGYNVFDPTEVVPEFTADVGKKKGEKVDYAIVRDGKPVILFECKRYGADLDKEEVSQLYRYFNTTAARFGVLTDGVVYRFFSDLEKPNLMDIKPFLEFNMLDIDESLVQELKKFTKSYFDVNAILTTANELKYTREIKRILGEQLSNPSEEFVRFFASQLYSGKMTKAVRERFVPITKNALHQFISDRISDRLKSALAGEETTSLMQKSEEPSASPDAGERVTNEELITEEELQAFYAVKAILHEVIPPTRLALRNRSGLGRSTVLLDDTNHKPICQFHFHRSAKHLGLYDEQKTERRVPIDDVDGIYSHAEQLKTTVGYYERAAAGADQ